MTSASASQNAAQNIDIQTDNTHNSCLHGEPHPTHTTNHITKQSNPLHLSPYKNKTKTKLTKQERKKERKKERERDKRIDYVCMYVCMDESHDVIQSTLLLSDGVNDSPLLMVE